MWTSTVGLINGKHRYLTAETFGFKINSNGQVLKKRQQWTIEPFPENLGPDGSISSAASVTSVQSPVVAGQHLAATNQQSSDPNDPCILTFSPGPMCSSLGSVKSSSNAGSSNASDQGDAYGEEHENVAIKSHLGKYLAVDSFGNVTCDSEEKTETARFTITICSMSQGKSKDERIFWAFKNVERGYYLGTTDDGMVCCNAKMPKSQAELWHLHLIPARGASFFAIKSLGRRRFARVADDDASTKHSSLSGQVQLDSTTIWGPETLFQFKYYEGGRYSLLTSDCKLLTNEGKCIGWDEQDDSTCPPAECLFTLEYHSGFLAFRDSFSHYLAAAGRSSVLRSRSIGVSRDELFAFEPAPIQVSMKATFNNRWVSIKQGVDLSANQTETSSKYETFQLTYHKQTKNWSIMTHDCNFWTGLHSTGAISICKPGDYEGLTRGQFRLVWSENDASFSLQYVDANAQERWVSARKSGQLFLSNGTQPPVQFIMRFQNRRLFNLRPVEGSGFVGIKPGVGSKQLEANKTAPDSFAIEYPESTASVNGVSGVLDLESPISKCPPAVGPKPTFADNHGQTTAINNPFNIKLNSTRLGKSMLADNDDYSKASRASPATDNNQSTKELECCIDDNNNDVEDSRIEQPDIKRDQEDYVESTAAPSVASIISSFSNVKLKKEPAVTKQQQSIPTRMGVSTARLASAFNNGTSATNNGQNNELPDTASVITSCLAASHPSTASKLSNQQQELPATNQQQLVDQIAQMECCYLKTICNDRYLVVDDRGSSVSCEATNKACAQTWIIELRSNNSLAIRASDNHAYMQLGTNGTITLSRCEPKDATLWEF